MSLRLPHRNATFCIENQTPLHVSPDIIVSYRFLKYGLITEILGKTCKGDLFFYAKSSIPMR